MGDEAGCRISEDATLVSSHHFKQLKQENSWEALYCNYIDQSTWVRWASSSERVSLAVRGKERLDMTQDSKFWHNLARPEQECFYLYSRIHWQPTTKLANQFESWSNSHLLSQNGDLSSEKPAAVRETSAQMMKSTSPEDILINRHLITALKCWVEVSPINYFTKDSWRYLYGGWGYVLQQ